MGTLFNFNDVSSLYYDTTTASRLKNCTIGIAGAGGIGSNCATLLVRSGFHQFVVADFDHINTSNLNRQSFSFNQIGQIKVESLKENCRLINPALSMTTHPVRVEHTNIHAIFDTCDVIIEAFDDPAAKALLFNEYLQSKKLLVGASGIAGIGSNETIGIRKIRENCFVVGDETSAVGESLQPYAPRVTIVAAMMANIVLEWATR